MLLAISSLKDYAIEATDGRLGTVSDFLFDDQSWKLRWLVVDTGSWLSGRKVLIQPSVIGAVNFEASEFMVALTQAQVKDSPDIAQDSPISQRMQDDLYGHYGWDPLWGGGFYGLGGFGAGYVPLGVTSPAGELREAERGAYGTDEGDPHLRSIAEVTGYHVHATDGGIGHIQDFLIDNTGWGIRYLIVDTANWWFGQHVLISPYAVRAIDWPDRQVHLDVTRQQVQASPPWDPAAMINDAFEKRLHTYYGWPGYGW